MPVVDGYGYSDETQFKNESFEQIFSLHVRLAGSVMAKFKTPLPPFLYVDITAGPGVCSDVVGPLIPVRAMRRLANHELANRYRALFIEREPETANTLRSALAPWGSRARVIARDHLRVLPQLIEDVEARQRQHQYGLVFFDPTPTVDQWDTAVALSNGLRLLPKVDVMMYLSATVIKRLSTIGHPRFESYLAAIGKQHWLIREPRTAYQWTFAIGSNWKEYPSWKGIGFHRIDSPHGRAILDRLHYTNRELQRRPPLPTSSNQYQLHLL